MKFAKVHDADDANGRHVAVYEARRDMDVPEITDKEGRVLKPATTASVPDIPEAIDAQLLTKALEQFPKGVLALSASVDGGVSVRVEARPAAPCPKCKEPVEGEWGFCPKCGAAQEEASA